MFLLNQKFFGAQSNMFIETLAPDTKLVLEKISKVSWLKKYYLAGGTALALQYGHRQSIDLDWFTEKQFSTKILLSQLQKFGKFEIINEEENTLEGYLDGVKMSFMFYPYSLLKLPLMFSGKVKIADKTDIALMKITAISSRNTKKDFIDLYWYLNAEKTDLISLFAKLKKKYSGVNYDVLHICKSLVYFKEADSQPLPQMMKPIDWGKVKKFFVLEVKKIV
jgi:hypothetical protein